ncbi:site-specific recombinase XerD [Aneurinibacillus soli]|uniref:Site-specific tyrosine recombinase XerC n=1 Tax=Aneurinibacillus soli TaxID=1500254 RepID=A0A0U4NIF8_9BACL|nr:site-specific integrase [Aneurinibacillus soli]PYE57054.1 site-specific recombinase XerD [Aneurinibacillus soli]BAU28532.1 site-specific tyrosine recombinase XerC [Aneurinibacillus soli]BAU29236.1 site-specific tyrosine recombinase XerC [Aneurinibacillus soli]
MKNGYYHMYCPKDVQSRYKLLVFDETNKPFLPLTDFYDDVSRKISKSSALSYLQSLLPFFTWMDRYSNYQGERVTWSYHPEAIRVAVEDYLMNEMACKVREKDSFRFVKLSNKSPNTVHRFLSALKSFYKSLITLRQYMYANPLIDSHAILDDYKVHTEGVRENKPRMPAEAGTEDPLVHRRLTDSYFKLINEEWQPEIIDDPFLYHKVKQAGNQANWSLREKVIARMLFETGARASEVIELTIGDYRSRKSFQEVNTFNKGSHGRRVKFLRFSKDTVKLLFQYINQERKKFDPLGRDFDFLPNDEPMFLTERGTPFNYQAWYPHWNKVITLLDMRLNPHKTRHWFVTISMREIYNISKNDVEIAQRKNELITYMKWKQKDTIEVYEHHFDEESHRNLHDKMLENMTEKEKEYMEQSKRKRTKKTVLNVLEIEKETELDTDIQALLDGLED